MAFAAGGKYELVDGVAIAMAGGKRRHDRVVVNAIAALAAMPRSGSCLPFTADTAIRVPAGNIRYADAGIDCGRFDDEATLADAPALVIEVLSESTRLYDFTRKLEEYKTVPTLTHILFVDLDAPDVTHWRRDAATGWGSERIAGLEASIELADLGPTLPLSTLYAGLEFRSKPRLVYPE